MNKSPKKSSQKLAKAWTEIFRIQNGDDNKEENVEAKSSLF